MRTAPRVLPLPEGLRDEHDASPRAFWSGAHAARDGIEECANPYTMAAQRRAWAAGWLAQREGWTHLLEHAR